MDDLVLRALLSFVVGGAWITFALVMAERLGNKVGGIFISLPSTTLVSMFFIGWTKSAQYAAETAAMETFGLLASAFFLFVLIATLKRYGNKAFLLAFVSWFIVAALIKTMGWQDMLAGAALYAVVCLVMYQIIEKKMEIGSAKVRAKSHTAGELLMKGCIAGGMVAATVIVANLAGPWWGGVLAAFPAATVSAMYMLNKEHGPSFAMATGKVVLPASLNIVVFIIAVNLTFPKYGIIYGSAISYAAAAAFALLLYFVMKSK